MEKRIIFLVVGLFLVIGGVVAYVGVPTTSNYSPFPLQEKTAEYSIVKSQNSYSLTYKRATDDLALLVGSTPVDLDQFVGRKVKVTGRFIDGKPYCKGDCLSVGTGKRPVVKIDSIAVAE